MVQHGSGTPERRVDSGIRLPGGRQTVCVRLYRRSRSNDPAKHIEHFMQSMSSLPGILGEQNEIWGDKGSSRITVSLSGVERISCQCEELAHRWKRLHAVCQGQNFSGMSRQGAPRWRTQRIPLSMRRAFWMAGPVIPYEAGRAMAQGVAKARQVYRDVSCAADAVMDCIVKIFL